jgi:hypothetical protein
MFDTPDGTWAVLPSAFRSASDQDIREVDRYSVESFLRRFKSDYGIMSHLREVLAPTDPVYRLTDDQVINIVSRRLASRELVLRETSVSTPGISGSGGGQSKPAEPAQASAPAPSRPASKAVEPEPATFSSNHDGTAQAAVLETGAAQAVPFLEECNQGTA